MTLTVWGNWWRPTYKAPTLSECDVSDPGARLALALSLLARLRDASREGLRVKERQLGRGLPATPAELDDTLRAFFYYER